MLTEIQIMKERQKDLEKVGYYIVRINPNKPDLDYYEEFGRVNAYIIKSTKKPTGKSLIDDLPKRLLGLEFKSNTQ